MSTATAMDPNAWSSMRRQLAWLQAVLGLILIAMAAAGITWLLGKSDVIRARGVIIVDAEGRDRILIGAPVPVSADRQRKNAETAAVVLLSPDGSDRLILGEAPGPARDGNTGKRIAEAMGLTFHDPKGNERGGIGFLDNGRAVVVLDRASPSTDAVGMMVDDASNFAGMLIAYPAENAWALKLGTTGAEMAVEVYDPKSARRGELQLNGSEAPTWKFSPAPAQP